MRIGVISAGGVGGYLAAKLLAANVDVSVVARGKHLDAIRDGGLTLTTPEGTMTVKPRVATSDAAEIGPVDVVLFAVKMPDLAAAATATLPMLGPETGVIPFQNGVEATELLAPIVGADRAMSGACYIFSEIEGPGHIKQVGAPGRFLFGEADGSQSARSHAFRALATGAGIDAPEPADMRLEMWKKFSFLVAMSGMVATTRSNVGAIRSDPVMRAAFGRAIEEAVAVAEAEGVAMPPDSVALYHRFLDGVPAEARSSMAKDLDAGKPIEAEWLNGAVDRLGKARGVDTPVNSTLYAALRPFANGR
ncbi:MAG: 2-dehydropantoate 2-reductase [Bauldia sp.]|nr:2-dehydropantoate 2-reductase [Bauldia sp.]